MTSFKNEPAYVSEATVCQKIYTRRYVYRCKAHCSVLEINENFCDVQPSRVSFWNDLFCVTILLPYSFHLQINRFLRLVCSISISCTRDGHRTNSFERQDERWGWHIKRQYQFRQRRYARNCKRLLCQIMGILYTQRACQENFDR